MKNNAKSERIKELTGKIQSATNMVVVIASVERTGHNGEYYVSIDNVGKSDNVKMLGAISVCDCNTLGINPVCPEPWRVTGGVATIPQKVVVHWFKIDNVDNNAGHGSEKKSVIDEFCGKKQELLSTFDECQKRADKATEAFMDWMKKRAALVNDRELHEFMSAKGEAISFEDKVAFKTMVMFTGIEEL